MNLKNQHTNLDLSKRMEGLGVKHPNPNFYHMSFSIGGDYEYAFCRPASKFEIDGGISWFINDDDISQDMVKSMENESCHADGPLYPAFSVSELFIALGDYYPSWSYKNPAKATETLFIATVITKNDRPDGNNITTHNSFDRYSTNQATALATMLCDSIEAGHHKIDEVNQRLASV